ncbi:MAG: DUF2997 domain-containing protein [Firmicutes bacterium]|nr:DUF2997 domain-containing protein [Bacillota bacterium]
MARQVKVKVLPDGSVEADFVGFGGTDCLDEAERLAENLARFGLRADPTAVRRKTSAEIAKETGEEEQGRDRVPTRSR